MGFLSSDEDEPAPKRARISTSAGPGLAGTTGSATGGASGSTAGAAGAATSAARPSTSAATTSRKKVGMFGGDSSDDEKPVGYRPPPGAAKLPPPAAAARTTSRGTGSTSLVRASSTSPAPSIRLSSAQIAAAQAREAAVAQAKAAAAQALDITKLSPAFLQQQQNAFQNYQQQQALLNDQRRAQIAAAQAQAKAAAAAAAVSPSARQGGRLRNVAVANLQQTRQNAMLLRGHSPGKLGTPGSVSSGVSPNLPLSRSEMHKKVEEQAKLLAALKARADARKRAAGGMGDVVPDIDPAMLIGGKKGKKKSRGGLGGHSDESDFQPESDDQSGGGSK